MKVYEFTLTFGLPNETDDPSRYIAALAKAGCDDALIGLGQQGRIAFNFLRESTSAYAAITSAMADIKKVIPDAMLIEAAPDIVGLTDVADILGFSRQNMRKLMLKSGSAFPLPFHEGKPGIWHLAKILLWLKQYRKYQIDDTLIDVANVNMQFNIVKELSHIEIAVQDDIRSLVI